MKATTKNICKVLLIVSLYIYDENLNGQGIDVDNCTCKGLLLYGKVQIVDRSPDLRVEIVSGFSDIEVDTVTYTPSKCGEWKFVDRSPDIKVQYVSSGADLKIRFGRWAGITDYAKATNNLSINEYSCTFKKIKLFGKVKVVDGGGDIKIRVTDSGEDLRVKAVENFADECGEWQFVDSFPDFTVQYVSGEEDIKIRFVESWPGP
jgi:hypothetical protein